MKSIFKSLDGKYITFVEVDQNEWVGYFGANGRTAKFKMTLNHYDRKWTCFHYQTGEQIGIPFDKKEDIIKLLDFNIRLGVKY